MQIKVAVSYKKLFQGFQQSYQQLLMNLATCHFLSTFTTRNNVYE